MDEGITQTNGPEDKKINDDAQDIEDASIQGLEKKKDWL